jgi:hypothetical protein
VLFNHRAPRHHRVLQPKRRLISTAVATQHRPCFDAALAI